MKLKLLIVANNADWKSWPQKITELSQWFMPKVELKIDIEHTKYDVIPFTEYTAGKYGVESMWYDKFVGSLAKDYDLVLFVVNNKQWRVPNAARGWRTDREQGSVEMQIACDENDQFFRVDDLGIMRPIYSTFFNLARHELLHALFLIADQPDTVHKWYDAAPYGQAIRNALDEIQFPTPHTADVQTIKNKLIKLIKQLINLLTIQKQKIMDEQFDIQTRLDLFCFAIQEREGWFTPNKDYPRGSRSWRNNNPGNVKFVQQMKLATGKDKNGFAIFKTYEDGLLFLKNMILNAATGKSQIYKPTDTLYGFFTKYAPSTDNNDPKLYAEIVAKKVGVQPTQTLAQLFT